jgi:hypothetical protein
MSFVLCLMSVCPTSFAIPLSIVNGQAIQCNTEFIFVKLRHRTSLHQLVQRVFRRVAVIFDTKMVGDLARRETLFGVAEQKFEDFDLEFLGGESFAATLFFLGHRFGAIQNKIRDL